MSTYFEELRRRVGRQKILIPRTAAILTNERDEVLLALDAATKEWGLPGGAMDLGETVRGSLRRILREQLGAESRDESLVGIHSGPEHEMIGPSGEETASVTIAFLVRAHADVSGASENIVARDIGERQFVEGRIDESGSVAELRWVSIDALPDAISVTSERILEDYICGRERAPSSIGGTVDYVAAIRERIGHDLLMLPTTAFILLEDNDRILLHRRSDNGRWCCPGGVVDIGETIAASALREVREETGLEVDDAELFGVFAGDGFEAEYQNGDRTAVVQFVFIGRTWNGELRIDDESTDVGFFDVNDIPSSVPPSHAGFLRLLPAYLRGEITTPIVP